MPRTTTCGAPHQATQFDYNGTVASGVQILFTKTPSAHVSAAFLEAMRRTFSGREIRGGFNMTDPSPGCLGEWVRNSSAALNGNVLTPRHASFIAAILRDAGFLSVRLDRNTVYLNFF